MIRLQFWAYGSWDSLFTISQLQTYESRTLFNDNTEILLHPGNKDFASQRQNYAQKMQIAQVTKSLKNYAHQRETTG